MNRRTRKWLSLLAAALLAGCMQACAAVAPDGGAAGAAETEAPAAGETAAPEDETKDGTEEARAVAAGEMTLISINVRKADAHLLLCGDTAYLIDTGTKDSADGMIAVLRECGITRLDGVILTHTHKDHVGGLKKLLKSGIQVDHIYASAFYEGDISDHPAVKTAQKQDMEVIWLSAGDELPFGEGVLRAVGPAVRNPDKENNNSLVLYASAGGGSLLLTGDMEFPEEASLLGAGLIPRADVIKIGNHGEDDATSTELIRAVSPSLAVISTSTPDEPDTPSPRVINLLEKWNIRVLQTQNTDKYIRITFRNGEILTEMN